MVTRGLAAERVPWGSMYEFAITGSLAVAAAYVLLVRRYSIRWLGLLVTGFLVTVLGLAVHRALPAGRRRSCRLCTRTGS